MSRSSVAAVTGREPQLGGRLWAAASGLEPALGGVQRFDWHVWARLIDPKWPHKETLIAYLTPELCKLYAGVLIQILPAGAALSEHLDDGSVLGAKYSNAQRATAISTLRLISNRVGPNLVSTLLPPILKLLQLEAVDPVRIAIARALGEMGDARAEKPLLKALRGADWRFRITAISALGGVGRSESVRFLTDLLGDTTSLNESKAALEALGRLGSRLKRREHDRIFDLLMRVFIRGDSLLRPAAAIALGVLSDRRALDFLIQVAMQGRGELQCAVVQALGILGDAQAVPPLIFVLTTAGEPARNDAVEALIRIGQAAIVPAMAVLRHPEAGVRCGVIQVLGRLAAQDAIQPLMALTLDSDTKVRRSAVSALGLIGSSEAVDVVTRALEDSDPGVRKEAAISLGGFRDARSVGPLCLALWDADMMVRWFAVYSLGVIGDPRSINPLIQALSDRSENVARTAADALLNMGEMITPHLLEYVAVNPNAIAAQSVLRRLQVPATRENILGLQP